MNVLDRLTFVPERCRGKKVLDLGCIGSYAYDLAPKGPIPWLHDEIKQRAAQVIGFDIEQERAATLTKMGYDIRVGNVFDLPELLKDERFDVIVAGELIEHLSNPGQFLDILKSLLRPGGEIILTTPNPGNYINLFFLLRGRLIASHTDHVAWYDMETIKCLGEKHGLCLTEVYHYNHRALRKFALPRRAIEALLFRIQPRLAPGLVAVLRPA